MEYLLLSEEERIAHDIALKVTREKHFDVASCTDVSGANIGKAGPGAEGAIGDKVGILVDTRASVFLIRVLLLLIFALLTFFVFGSVAALGCRFDNVVISVGAANLTEEADEGASLLCCEALERFLEQVHLLLTKSDSGRIEKLLIAEQVLDVADGGRFSCFLLVVALGLRFHE